MTSTFFLSEYVMISFCSPSLAVVDSDVCGKELRPVGAFVGKVESSRRIDLVAMDGLIGFIAMEMEVMYLSVLLESCDMMLIPAEAVLRL
jgi:hypothetical protein